MTIGLQIKTARESLGLSMSELARRSGISKSVVSRLEAGLHEDGLKIETLRALADALGIPHGELLSYMTDMLPSSIIKASVAAEQAVNAQEYVARLVDLHEAVKAITHGLPARKMKRDED